MSTRSIFLRSRFLPLVIRYRWLIYELVLRDLRLRYRGSIIGFAWTMLNPLLFAAVYVLIFGVFLKVGLPHFALYLLAGLLPWNWFAGAVQQGTTSIVDGRSYVGKTIFPTEVLVFVPMLSYAVNFFLSLPLVVVVMLLYHTPLNWTALAFLPLVALIQAVLTLAALFVFSTLNVFYRDFSQLVTYLILLLFYLIPIVYPADRIPPPLHGPLLADPFAIVIVAYQDIFYYSRPPDLSALALAAIAGTLFLAAAYALFDRYKEAMGEFV
ncbi:MAG TPA: ABC transporter permease [Verrucomicrobiae bacterium]|nr:ABC transporter permease [Verrucomicrobiae bacterium]